MPESTSTKKTLLGELESIKGLLDDDIDLDQIPILLDDVPLLEDAIDTGIEAEAEQGTETRPKPLYEPVGNPSAEEGMLPEGVLPGQQALFDDQALISTVTGSTTNLESKDVAVPDDSQQTQANSIDLDRSCDTPVAEEQPFATANDATEDADTSADLSLEDSLKQAYAGFYGDTENSDKQGLKPLEVQTTQVDPEAEAPTLAVTNDAERQEPPSPSVPKGSHQNNLENPSKPVLNKNTIPSDGVTAIREQAPHLSGLASSPVNNSMSQPQSKPRPVGPNSPSLRGENPFLPKHIRDRLHTQKSLPDIIRDESALSHPGSVSKSATAAIVDNLIAEYMPRIESELRHRLALILEGKSQPANTPKDKD